MINEDLISDISYTSKDFNSIYPELLDLVKKLSSKWDPSLSNESDPGVLLLKLNAIIADKNNYNIDKNVLECFPLSVTQEGNARKLYSMLGYYMHWYRSATTKVSIQLKSIPENLNSLNIKQFTRITDPSKQKVFTIIESKSFSKSNINRPIEVKAIEGSIIQYSTSDIDDNYLITLNNLDSNLRLYFKEKFIAENGIFIAYNDNSNNDNNNLYYSNELCESYIWHRVDNLSSYPFGNTIYEFGVLPNSNTCYIQFPQDIGNLIKDGIKIKYTITQGQQGNIKNNTLSLFYDDINEEIEGKKIKLNDNIKISQPIGTTNGVDPENIDDAYRNYKRTVGTFNNLVTIRDYENFIFHLKEDDKFLISNIRVCDRINDINYSNSIQEWTPIGDKKISIFKKSDDEKDILDPFQLVFYLLNNPNSLDSINSYDDSFTIADESTLESIEENGLNEAKVIQHNIALIQDPQLPGTTLLNSGKSFKKFIILNEFPLNISIFTYDRVTRNDIKEIEENIRKKLFLTYNSQKLTFGESINYQKIINYIKSSDSRIKNIFLDSPQYSNNFILLEKINNDINQKIIGLSDSDEKDRNDLNNELIARMVCSGNVQLYKFDDSFDVDFGQINGDKISTDNGYTQIKTITSETALNLTNNDLELLKNESIQIIEPALIPISEYSSYVKYSFTYTNEQNQTSISKNKNYTLLEGQTLTLYYTKNGIEKQDSYGQGTIINSNIELSITSATSQSSGTQSLGSGNYIRILEPNIASLAKGTKYYFLMNNEKNRLTINQNEGYILEDGEYFIYTSPFTDELIILSSGTELRSGDTQFDETIPNPDKNILEQQDIEKINWHILGQSLETVELNITSLGEGVKVKTKELNATIDITNTLIDLNEITIQYKEESSSDYIDIQASEIENIKTRVRSRLFINASSNIPQTLTNSLGKRVQSLEFTFNEDANSTIITTTPSTPGANNPETTLQILFNSPIYLQGGKNIDVKVLNNLGELEYTLEAYKFNTSNFSNIAGIKNRNENGNILINDSMNDQDKIDIQLNFNFSNEDKTYLIPIYLNVDALNTTTNPNIITFYNSSIFNRTNSNNDADLKITGNKSFILKVKAERDRSYLKISSTSSLKASDYITIGKISIIDNDEKYNTPEINSINKNFPYDLMSNKTGSSIKNYEDIENKILEITGNDKNLDWTYRVPEKDKVLYPIEPNSFWNKNHIYNPFTLPKINFKSTTIKMNDTIIN